MRPVSYKVLGLNKRRDLGGARSRSLENGLSGLRVSGPKGFRAGLRAFICRVRDALDVDAFEFQASGPQGKAA